MHALNNTLIDTVPVYMFHLTFFFPYAFAVLRLHVERSARPKPYSGPVFLLF